MRQRQREGDVGEDQAEPGVEDARSRVSILNSGVTSAICGNIEISSDIADDRRLPGKSRRAMAYAAMVPSTSATKVAIRQMPIELISARMKSSLLEDLSCRPRSSAFGGRKLAVVEGVVALERQRDDPETGMKRVEQDEDVGDGPAGLALRGLGDGCSSVFSLTRGRGAEELDEDEGDDRDRDEDQHRHGRADAEVEPA